MTQLAWEWRKTGQQSGLKRFVAGKFPDTSTIIVLGAESSAASAMHHPAGFPTASEMLSSMRTRFIVFRSFFAAEDIGRSMRNSVPFLSSEVISESPSGSELSYTPLPNLDAATRKIHPSTSYVSNLRRVAGKSCLAVRKYFCWQLSHRYEPTVSCDQLSATRQDGQAVCHSVIKVLEESVSLR